jgi:hypothetical protein
MKTNDKFTKKLKITHEKFIALMPLPKYHSEWEIKLQIRELTNQGKKNGHLKSFSIKPNASHGASSAALVFTFVC